MTDTVEKIDTMIGEIVQAVVNAAHPERVILFGSAARGERQADSDVDLLVVEKKSSFKDGSRWAECSWIRRALSDFPVPIDLLLFTLEEVEKWKDSTEKILEKPL